VKLLRRLRRPRRCRLRRLLIRDSLHQFVIREPSFPWNPKEALREGFAKAEKKFMENNYSEETGIIDKSGS